MNWVKTYESFKFDNANDNVDKFEDIIKIPKMSGVITGIDYDEDMKTLRVELISGVGAYDMGGVITAVEKSKAKIRKQYPGVSQVFVGSTTIPLK